MSQGGNYLNGDNTINVTSPEAVKAFTALTNYVLEDGITDLQGLTEAGAMENYQQLYAGRCLYVPHGPWVVAEGLSTFGLTHGEDFTYTAMPWFGEKKAFPAETGWAIAVNAASDKQEAAFRFLEYFFSDEVIRSHNVACGQIPAKKSVSQSPEYLEQFPYAEPLVGILENAQFIGPFNTDQFKEVICNTFTDYCTGGIYGSIDEALADMEGKLNDIVIK